VVPHTVIEEMFEDFDDESEGPDEYLPNKAMVRRLDGQDAPAEQATMAKSQQVDSQTQSSQTQSSLSQGWGTSLRRFVDADDSQQSLEDSPPFKRVRQDSVIEIEDPLDVKPESSSSAMTPSRQKSRQYEPLTPQSSPLKALADRFQEHPQARRNSSALLATPVSVDRKGKGKEVLAESADSQTLDFQSQSSSQTQEYLEGGQDGEKADTGAEDPEELTLIIPDVEDEATQQDEATQKDEEGPPCDPLDTGRRLWSGWSGTSSLSSGSSLPSQSLSSVDYSQSQDSQGQPRYRWGASLSKLRSEICKSSSFHNNQFSNP